MRANVGNSILSEVAKDCHQVNWEDSIAVSLFTNISEKAGSAMLSSPKLLNDAKHKMKWAVVFFA